MCDDCNKTDRPREPRIDEGFLKAAQERLQQGRTQCPSPGGQIGSPRDPFDDLFTYHAPQGDQLLRYQAIRDAARNFANVLRANCPNFSRDYDEAIDHVRDAMMRGNASIALQRLF